MTNEQREAIKLAKEFTRIDFSNPLGWTGYYDTELKELSDAIETVLSLITEQEEKMENKDKQIDLMAECIESLDNCKSSMCDKFNKNCIVAIKRSEICLPCIKQYFERKVKDG